MKKRESTFFWASFCNLGTSSINLAFTRRTSAFIATTFALLVSIAAISDFYKFRAKKEIETSDPMI